MQFSSEPSNRPSVASTNQDVKPQVNNEAAAFKAQQVPATHSTPSDISAKGAMQPVVSGMNPNMAYPAGQLPGNLVKPTKSVAIKHITEEEQGATDSTVVTTSDGHSVASWSDARAVDSNGGIWLAQADTDNTNINTGGSTAGSAGMSGSVGGDAGTAPYSHGGAVAPAQGATPSGGVLDSLGLANVSAPVLVGGGVLLASGMASMNTKSTATEPVGFSLSGTIVMGKVIDATGLVIEAFRADGTKLAGTGTVNNDGTYSISITENYSGPVLIRLKDTNPGTNYTNEATGTAQDLSTDLRAVVNVGGHGTITVAITPLTELATRNLLGDSGGDGGTSTSTLGTSVTTSQVNAANTAVQTAFGLSSDILSTTPVSVDNTAYTSATSAQKAYGNALAAISGAEVVSSSSTSDVLSNFSQGMVGGVLSKSGAELLVAGASQAATTYPGTISATAFAQSFDTGLSAIHISNDTGTVSNDFITSSNTQVITATLTTALSGTNHLWGSVDGGATWTDVTSLISGSTLNWNAPNLVQGDSSIKFAVTAAGVTQPVVGGSSNNVIGSVTVQAYSVDSAAPQFTSAATASFAENATGTVYAAAATDANLLTYSISGGADANKFQIDSHSGAVSFVSVPNFEAPTDAGANNVYNITITATDGAGNLSSQAVAIVVTNVNEAPALTSGTAVNFAENGTGTAYTITATDPDANTTLTYAIGGTDASLFNVDASTGAVTFKAAPNFEAPAHANNVYNITVTASDGALTTAPQAVAITVTNVNEAPSVSSAATASFAENGTGTAYTITGTDPDANTTLTYSISGGDSGLFNINANTGAVTFKTTPNYEAPADANADNVYSFTVTTSDGQLSSSQSVSITVTDVNEAPISTTVTPAPVVVGQAYSFSVASNFSDPDTLNPNEHLTYAATGLPTGLAINSSTGVISGTDAVSGTSHVTVTATDIANHTTSQQFDLNAYSTPTLSSHLDNVTNLEVTSKLVLTSTENLTAVTGKSIHIINDVGGGFHGEASSNTLDYLVTDTAHVTITGNSITINPGFDLDFNNNYHITVDAGAFTGNTSGLASAAITDPTAINFSTVNPTATLTGAAATSQAMVSGTDAMVAGHGWYDAEGNSNIFVAPTTLNMGSGDIAIVATDYGTGPGTSTTTGIATNGFYMALTNFGNGDLIYIDNHGDNTLQRQGDIGPGVIVAPTNVAPTQVVFPDSGSATGNGGGQFDVTVAGSTQIFGDTATLKVLMGNVTYEPIYYG